VDIKYDLHHVSGWRWIFTCTGCGEHTDSGDHDTVCAKCGGQHFTRQIGRWNTLRPRLTFWQQVMCFFMWVDPYLLKVEFKDKPNER
jgi:hypothetical protein